MKWTDIFQEAPILTEEEAETFMAGRPIGSYQLVDVRQPEEYEQHHLPGATLVPLNILISGGSSLSPEKPVIVYCRAGVRSRTAAQYLTQQKFKEVYDIGSNISSWLGIQVPGSYTADLHLIKKEADFPDVLCMAYAMEEGIKRLYAALENQSEPEEQKDFFQKRKLLKQQHLESLMQNCMQIKESTEPPEYYLQKYQHIIERGLNEKDTEALIPQLTQPESIFSLAIALEAQTFDFYSRMAQHAPSASLKSTLLRFAEEEREQMNQTTKEMKRFLNENEV